MASGIAVGRFVDVFGIEQWVTIRGEDRRSPVLLIVGGPGAALSRMTPLFAGWERELTIAHWDQPGAGATYAKHVGAGIGAMTLARLTRDGLAVAEFVRDTVGVPSIGLLAISGGTMVGLQMIAERPSLFTAYVGTGQFVDWPAQAARSYGMILERARAGGDRAAVAELESIGPPPYASVAGDITRGKHAGALTPAEQAAFAALDPAVLASLRTPPPDARYVPPDLPALDPRERSLAAYAALRGEYAGFNARQIGTRFPLPVTFIQGEHDAYATTIEVEEYASVIEGPAVAVATINGGGHSCVFMVGPFLEQLRRHLPR